MNRDKIMYPRRKYAWIIKVPPPIREVTWHANFQGFEKGKNETRYLLNPKNQQVYCGKYAIIYTMVNHRPLHSIPQSDKADHQSHKCLCTNQKWNQVKLCRIIQTCEITQVNQTKYNCRTIGYKLEWGQIFQPIINHHLL